MAYGGIEYEVKEHLGTLEKYQTGWTKEVNFVSWNGGDAKVDIRDWDPAHEKMSRGITLTEKEAKALLSILEKRFR